MYPIVCQTSQGSPPTSQLPNAPPTVSAAARFFQPPSENQDFKYHYVPTKARIPVGTLRTTFRKFGINNARLLDVHYPARNIAAILIHNDYEQEFKDLLRQHHVPIKDDFKPFSGTILADAKYADLLSEERDSIATELQMTRLSRALDHIRPPVLRIQWPAKPVAQNVFFSFCAFYDVLILLSATYNTYCLKVQTLGFLMMYNTSPYTHPTRTLKSTMDNQNSKVHSNGFAAVCFEIKMY
ncbi:hypothetical protein G6F37_012520 [Rhizopus arrhizus]|nr:hypothetical protein G6F38_011914 [Rhizopus arrhizus]KAG1143102.1 hypothetical protein G6F37_012520 [Rhizopus arrhizus]